METLDLPPPPPDWPAEPEEKEGKADEKEDKKEDKKIRYIISIDFGTTYSGASWLVYGEKWNGPLINQAWKRGGRNPTHLILEAKTYDFKAFGEDATLKKLSQWERKTPKKYLFFERFKMSLLHFDDYSKPLTCKDHRGTDHPAEKIFVPALRFLGDMAIDLIQRTYGSISPLEVRWVVTVPAIWDSHAKVKMKEWAQEARTEMMWMCPEHDVNWDDCEPVEIALEPETASLQCVSELKSPRGVPFLILDCGGGTVDCVIHYLDQTGLGLHELVSRFGTAAGSTYIDLEFEAVMAEILKQETVESIKRNYPIDWGLFIREFVNGKEGWKKDEEIEFDIVLTKIEQEIKKIKPFDCTSLEECIQRATPEEGEAILEMVDGKLIIPAKTVQRCFDASLNKIKATLQSKARDIELALAKASKENRISKPEVAYVYLVGGLCCSRYIQDSLKKFFQEDEKAPFKAEIKAPLQPVTAVLTGATRFGLSTIEGEEVLVIASRISPFTYGLKTSPAFEEKKHSKEKKYMQGGVGRCRDWFSVMIKEGERLEPGNPFLRTFKALHEQRSRIDLYQSSDRKSKYVTDPGVSYLTSLYIEHKSKFPNIEVFLEFFSFGASTWKVTAQEQKTGTPVECKLRIGKVDPKSQQTHFVFLLDRSGSMELQDITPPSEFYAERLQNRLGCVVHTLIEFLRGVPVDSSDLFSVIAFNQEAASIFDRKEIKEVGNMVSALKKLRPDGGTDFVKAFIAAGQIMDRVEVPRTRILFLTDGDAPSPAVKVAELMKKVPDLAVWSVKFSKNETHVGNLKKVAELGLGEYREALDAADLQAILQQFAVLEMV